MRLEDQVIIPEQAKRLKELGVAQSGAFSWFLVTDRDDEIGFNRKSRDSCPVCGHPTAPYIKEVSAFTVAELGAMLPAGHDTMYCTGEGWRGYDVDGNDFSFEPFATEAQTRAAMLIYLLEIGECTAEEVNKRLSS